VLDAAVGAAAAIGIAKLADPTTGKVIGSAGSAAAAVFPPGFEVGYDQITSIVNISSTTEATGTAVISCASHTFDGAAVMAEFFTPRAILPQAGSNNIMTVSLFESATEIGIIALALDPSLTAFHMPLSGRLRFTPTAGAHTYTVTAFVNNTTGTPQIVAGAGGTAAFVPAFCRFTKV
jgi:hypothetical protein